MPRHRNSSLTPDDVAIGQELLQRTEEALSKLVAEDREIIRLRDELTNLEAANALGLTPQATSMRYLRAKRRLRKILEDMGITGY